MHPKTCMVPSCLNTSRNSSKIFLMINKNLGPKWCLAAGIQFIPKNELYCCEDHIELQDAVENYHYWKMMGFRPRVNKNYVPSFSKENFATDHQPEVIVSLQTETTQEYYEVHLEEDSSNETTIKRENYEVHLEEDSSNEIKIKCENNSLNYEVHLEEDSSNEIKIRRENSSPNYYNDTSEHSFDETRDNFVPVTSENDLQIKREQELDQIDHFFLSMCKKIKKLPQADQTEISFKLQQMIDQAEIKMIRGND